MNQGLITRALLQTRPKKKGFDWGEHLAFVNSLFAGLPTRWGAYYDVAAPGGAKQPNGSPAVSQGDAIQTIANLLPNGKIGDLEYSLEATKVLLGSSVPDHPTTAILDYNIQHNDGRYYPGMAMSRGNPALWEDTGEDNVEQQNLLRTTSLFVPQYVTPPPPITGACMVTVFTFLFRELANFADVDLEENLEGLLSGNTPDFIVKKPGVLIYNFPESGTPGTYFNGTPMSLEGASDQLPDDLTGEITNILSGETGILWGSICTASQKMLVLPRGLTPTEIPEVTRRFLAAMETASV